MGRQPGAMHLTASQMDEEERVSTSAVTKSVAPRTSIGVRRNSCHVVVVLRSGAGGMPWRFKMLPTVWSLRVSPRLARAPTIRS